MRQLAWARMNVTDLRDVARAIELLEEALKIADDVEMSESDKADLLIDLSSAYEMDDQMEDAVEALLEASRLRRGDKSLAERIEQLRQKM